MPTYEGGLRPYRLEYVRETTKGVTPDNPSFQFFSDSVNGFDPDVDPSVDPQETLGNPDPQTFFAGTIGASLTVSYDLQLKAAGGNTLVDGSGNPNDAASDGFMRNADNEINGTHTILRRMEQSNISASSTVNGATSLDTRQYMVFKGAHPDPSIVHDPSDANPIGIENDYTCEKAEIHQLDQPAAATTISVVSNNANDSGTVTLEDEGAATTEDVSITAGGTTTSVASFADLDAVELSSEQPGDITITDGTNDLMVITGQNSYDHGEGDLGVPALGTGSRASAIGQGYESPQATTIERPAGAPLSEEVMTVDIDANNNFSDDERSSTPRPLVVANGREVTADVTVVGETEYFDKIRAALTTAFDDFIYQLKGGSITLVNASVLDAEADGEEAQQGYMGVDATFRGTDVTLSA